MTGRLPEDTINEDTNTERPLSCALWLWAALLVAVLPFLFARPGIVVGETVTSRLATVYALVHHHTWRIDRPSQEAANPFEQLTVDKVQTSDGRMFSSKPPVLPLLMTFEYAALHYVFGWELTNPEDLRPIMRIIIFTLMKIPHVIGLFFFALLLRMFLGDGVRAAALLLTFAYATPLPGYASQLNNHTPAVTALLVALYYGLGIYTGKLSPLPRRFMIIGCCSALVFVMDMPVTIFPVALGALLFVRHPVKSVVWMGIGAAPLLLLHFGLMTWITGNPFPVQTRESLYNFRNSYWRNPIGVDGLNEPRLLYFFHMHLGRFGTLLLFPVLSLAFPGIVIGLRDPRCESRLGIIAAMGAIVIMTLYYTLQTNNYGGAAYGFRWHIGALPVLALLALPAIARMRTSMHWLAFAALLAISLYSSWECWNAPWGASHEWTCRWIFGPVY